MQSNWRITLGGRRGYASLLGTYTFGLPRSEPKIRSKSSACRIIIGCLVNVEFPSCGLRSFGFLQSWKENFSVFYALLKATYVTWEGQTIIKCTCCLRKTTSLQPQTITWCMYSRLFCIRTQGLPGQFIGQEIIILADRYSAPEYSEPYVLLCNR